MGGAMFFEAIHIIVYPYATHEYSAIKLILY